MARRLVEKEKVQQSVPGDGNCGFSSIAWLLLSLHLRNQLSEEQLHAFSKVYAKYYPELINPALSTKENITTLIQTLPSDILIETLAFSLRQYAVDIMVANPADYRGAFINNNEGTDPKTMRQNGTWVDSQALTAVARGLNINLQVKTDRFTAQLHERGNTEKATLHLSGKHYTPEIHRSTAQSLSRNVPSSYDATIKPRKQQESDPTLAKIEAKTIAADRRDQQLETRAQQLLTSLDSDVLLNLYRDQMPHSDYLPGRVSEVTQDHKGDLFFINAITEKQIDSGKLNELRGELVHALSKEARREPDFMSDIQRAAQLSQPALQHNNALSCAAEAQTITTQPAPIHSPS